MNNRKKKWTKPQLIILERIKPEESILTTCKTTGVTGPLKADCFQTDKSCKQRPSS